MKDIRWKQRFDNYTNALQTLARAVELSDQRDLSELEQQGAGKWGRIYFLNFLSSSGNGAP